MTNDNVAPAQPATRFPRAKLSAVVISFNRAQLIATCLRGVSFADEVIVVDKSSDDGTAEIAASLADRVISVPWSPVVEDTRAFAISACSYDWVLCLDDDECLSVEAARYIESELCNPKWKIYSIPQRHYILGIHDERAYYWPEYQPRLFHRGTVEFTTVVHGGTRFPEAEMFNIPPEGGVCIHHLSHESVWQWIDKTNRYTSMPARVRPHHAGRDILDFAHTVLDQWTQNSKVSEPGSYPAAAAILRAVYDIIDRLKAWEEEEGLDGAAAFRKICNDLDAQYEHHLPAKARQSVAIKKAQVHADLFSSIAGSTSVNLNEPSTNDLNRAVALLRDALRNVRDCSDQSFKQIASQLESTRSALDAEIESKKALEAAFQNELDTEIESKNALGKAFQNELDTEIESKKALEKAFQNELELRALQEEKLYAEVNSKNALKGSLDRAIESRNALEQALNDAARSNELYSNELRETEGRLTSALANESALELKNGVLSNALEAAKRLARKDAEVLAHLEETLRNEARAGIAREEQLNTQLRELTRRVHELEMSTTWRAAAPIRALASRHPPGARFLRRTLKVLWWTASLQLPKRIAQRRLLVRDALIPVKPMFDPGALEAAQNPMVLDTRPLGPRAPALPPVDSAMDRPLVVCLSHVAPYPPRAGNEYRIHSVLSWLRSKGMDPVLLYCPLIGEEPNDAQLSSLATKIENLVYVHRSGHVRYSTARPDVEALIASINGRQIRDVARLVGENSEGPAARLLDVMRSFCPDALVEVMCAIDHALAPKIMLVNYVFMTRGMALLRHGTFKVVDTHDVFSTKSEKVVPFGVADDLAMSEGEEAHLLSTCDLVLAIQPEEAKELRRIAPGTRVVTVGIDMPVDSAHSEFVQTPVVLLVASGNPMNAKGLRDFLRFAWPRVIRAIPNAELQVVGSVCKAVPGNEPGVRRLGFVDDLSEAYEKARVVINPAVAGTGMKIKTLEALAYLRPLVTWPSGVDGVEPELRDLCTCVTDWYAFSEAVIRILSQDDDARRVRANRDRIAELLSSITVFAELESSLAKLQSSADNVEELSK